PELEAQVVLEVGHVDEAVDEDGDHRHEDAEVERPPVGISSAPSEPAETEGRVQNPPEREHAKQACLSPEVEQDVVRVNEAVAMVRAPIRSQLLRESRQA